MCDANAEHLLCQDVIDALLETRHLIRETLDQAAGDLARDITVALMLVLERLSPLERASFLLHDVFGLDFAEVSRALGRSEAACRQLGARAREHIAAGRPRFPASSEDGRRLASAFHKALLSGDAEALAQMLAHDVVLYSDGGGRRPAAKRPLIGIDDVMRFQTAIAGVIAGMTPVRYGFINGLPGFITVERDGVQTTAFEIADGKIAGVYVMRNPEKLRHLSGDAIH